LEFRYDNLNPHIKPWPVPGADKPIRVCNVRPMRNWGTVFVWTKDSFRRMGERAALKYSVHVKH